MQRKSFLNSSIALITAVGQLLTRELSPPPGSDQQREAGADLLVANANVGGLIEHRHNGLLRGEGGRARRGRGGVSSQTFLSQVGQFFGSVSLQAAEATAGKR